MRKQQKEFWIKHYIHSLFRAKEGLQIFYLVTEIPLAFHLMTLLEYLANGSEA